MKIRKLPVAFVVLAAGCAQRPAPRPASSLDPAEVTVADYARCVDAGRCSPPHEKWRTCNWQHRGARGGHPINCVDWKQAESYCAFAGKHLPTEQEWEQAAGGDGRVYPWGNAAPAGQACTATSGTCPVRANPADRSPAGIFDMAGNVKEWTASAEKLPGGSEARVIRGGGWDFDGLSEMPPVRIAEREFLPPSEFAADLGFRCAANAP